MRQGKSLDQGLSSLELTNHLTTEDLIRQKRRQLMALQKAKDEFISISSHQLRTPATCVKQYLGMMLEGYAGDVPEHLQSFIQKAYDNNEKQLMVLASILQVAELDLGIFNMRKSTQSACQLVQDAIDSCSRLTDLHGQQVVFKHPQECELVSDPDLVKLVLMKLLENASQNSPSNSEIYVKLSQTRLSTKIRIRDNGPGIAKEHLKDIFKKFTHIENEYVNTVNGNGLGLYIARKITRKLDGTLTVRSEPEVGSTFTLTFKSKSENREQIL